jgi:hypothetical protein
MTIIGFVLLCLLFVVSNSGFCQQSEIKAPLLTGKTWTVMSQDQKTAYIWGAGDVIDLEQELMDIYPELRQENFAMKSAEGIGDVTINEIVSTVDSFYKENPDRKNLSVMEVIWYSMIKPNIKTGIAGKPLQ